MGTRTDGWLGPAPPGWCEGGGGAWWAVEGGGRGHGAPVVELEEGEAAEDVAARRHRLHVVDVRLQGRGAVGPLPPPSGSGANRG